LASVTAGPTALTLGLSHERALAARAELRITAAIAKSVVLLMNLFARICESIVV
jgi:hypothetical protein